jgi:membrane protease YdiL (CAAX protease family)
VDSLDSSLSQPADFSTQPAPAPPPQRNVVFFNDRGLRAGWRLLIYILLVLFFATFVHQVSRWVHPPTHQTPTPGLMLISEAINFAVVFGAALIMAKIEKCEPGAYGLPTLSAFGKNFWLGMLLGLLEVSALMGLIAAFGGYSFGRIALSGAAIVGWGLVHLFLFTLVGLFEEFAFRGYMQFTLGDGIGFWPAGIVTSLLFALAHRTNEGENYVGLAGVLLVAFLFVFTIQRTGNLWYAVGLHASFDWGETFLYSVPDSGLVLHGHLSDALLHGPKWLTGGSAGPEGSAFCFLTMALQFLAVMWLFPKRKESSNSPVALAGRAI